MSKKESLFTSITDNLEGKKVPYDVAVKLSGKIMEQRGYIYRPIIYGGGISYTDWDYYPKNGDKNITYDLKDDLTGVILKNKADGEAIQNWVIENLPR